MRNVKSSGLWKGFSPPFWHPCTMARMRVESTLGCQVLMAVVCQLHVLGGTVGHLPDVQLRVRLEVTCKFGRQASSIPVTCLSAQD